MDNNTTTVVIKSEKSNAPLICGIIGFVLEIPNLACNVLCAAFAGASAGLASDSNDFDSTTADQTTDAMIPFIWIGFLLSLLCFIFCFFGKKKCANVLGIITILAALYVTIMSCISFSLFGLAAGILFLVQGIVMITNSKK